MDDTDAFLEMFDVNWYQNGDSPDKLQPWLSIDFLRYSLD